MNFKKGDQFTINWDKLIANGNKRDLLTGTREFYEKEKASQNGRVFTVLRVQDNGTIIVYDDGDPKGYPAIGVQFVDKYKALREKQ